MNDMIIKNARLREGNVIRNIIIKEGIIYKITEDEINDVEGYEVIDAEKKLVTPPFVEPHIHLDYVFTDNSNNLNNSGTLFEGIKRWSEFKDFLTEEEIEKRALKAIKMQIATGIQYIRTHVDVTDPKMTGLKAILSLKEKLKNYVDIQIVAFPQEGMYSFKNGDKLVEEALKLGADVVGAIPHFEFTREDGVNSVKKAIELAVKYDKLVDAHCDEIDDEQSRFIEVLAAEAYKNGIGEKVTASHSCAMGSYNGAYAYKLFKLLRESKINIVSCPTENIHLQGRFDTYPKRRGLTRVKELIDDNINVCFAQDSIMDPWYPLGNGNLLSILDAGVHICQLTDPEHLSKALDLITVNGAKTLNIKEYGIKEGFRANLLILNGQSDFEMIQKRECVLYSIRNGKILAKNKPIKTELFL